MIPKVIHFCWFGGSPLPNQVKKSIASWQKQCPDYEIRKWDETMIDVGSHPFMKAAYDAKSWAFVSDYARLKIVYEHGGVYLDTDVELLKPLDSLLVYDSFFALQQSRKQCATGLGFGAEEKSEIVGAMLREYDEVAFDDEKCFEIRCPVLNTNAIRKFGFEQSDAVQVINNNILLPPRYMDPTTPGDYEDLMCSDTISIHHYSASWMSKSHQFKRKIINLIGQDKINRLKKIIKRKDH